MNLLSWRCSGAASNVVSRVWIPPWARFRRVGAFTAALAAASRAAEAEGTDRLTAGMRTVCLVLLGDSVKMCRTSIRGLRSTRAAEGLHTELLYQRNSLFLSNLRCCRKGTRQRGLLFSKGFRLRPQRRPAAVIRMYKY